MFARDEKQFSFHKEEQLACQYTGLKQHKISNTSIIWKYIELEVVSQLLCVIKRMQLKSQKCLKNWIEIVKQVAILTNHMT